jgi:hypothetical protein
MILPTILINSQKSSKKELSYQALLLIGLVSLTVTPYVAGSNRSKKPQPILNTIEYVESLQIDDPVFMLEVEGGYDYYLDANYSRVFHESRSTGFYQYLQDNSINMIVITEALKDDTRFRGDPEWQEFLDNYKSFGFELRDIPKTAREILIHKELLE